MVLFSKRRKIVITPTPAGVITCQLDSPAWSFPGQHEYTDFTFHQMGLNWRWKCRVIKLDFEFRNTPRRLWPRRPDLTTIRKNIM